MNKSATLPTHFFFLFILHAHIIKVWMGLCVLWAWACRSVYNVFRLFLYIQFFFYHLHVVISTYTRQKHDGSMLLKNAKLMLYEKEKRKLNKYKDRENRANEK